MAFGTVKPNTFTGATEHNVSVHPPAFCAYKHRIMKADVFILAQAQTQILEIPLSLAKADCAVGLRVFINPLEHRGKSGGCSVWLLYCSEL